jgi:peptidoglycan hydrolase CwlO-like protein
MVEFIIKQQESLSEAMAHSESRISRLETAAVHLYNAVTDLNKAQKDLTVKMAELAEAQAHTEQRLNVIIDIIEQGRNGKS